MAVSASAAPRVVVQPLSSSVPVPGTANAALLTSLARLSIELPSTFEVDDALSSVPARSCGGEVACLAGLARATRCGWSVAVTLRTGDAPALLAIVVSAEGAVVRKNELVLSAMPASEDAWLSEFRALMTGLALETLGSASADTPIAQTHPREEKKEAPVAPLVVKSEPPKSSAKTGVAVATGVIAVGAGAAAATLAFINLSEARALEASRNGAGLIPAASVDRAVSLDERTVAATALGIGAGVAALTTLTVLLIPDSAPVSVAPAVSAQGGAVFLRGQLP